MDRLATPPASPRRSPLAASSPCAVVDIEIIERRDLAKLRLRTPPRAADAFAAAFGQSAGLALPVSPNRVAGDRRFSVAWTAPGAWLALGERAACAAMADAAAALPSAAAALVTPVSSGLCALEVAGARAAQLLASGCPLDLLGGAVGEGGCASSLFGETPVFIQRLSGSSRYTIVVERPLAWSLWAALADNARLLPGGSVR